MATSKIRAEPFRWSIVAAAAVVGLLHVLGALQVREQVYRGYRSGDDRVIIEVIQGGPADRAGLRVGDRLTRIDGIDAGDAKALAARPRARVGHTQSIVIDRGGSSMEVQLILAGLPPIGVVAYLASGLTGLSFLAFGLWAYFSAPRRTSRLLANAGIGLGAIFTEQPYVASPFPRALQESGLIAAGVFGFAALLHFALVFPTERKILGRRQQHHSCRRGLTRCFPGFAVSRSSVRVGPRRGRGSGLGPPATNGCGARGRPCPRPQPQRPQPPEEDRRAPPRWHRRRPRFHSEGRCAC